MMSHTGYFWRRIAVLALCLLAAGAAAPARASVINLGMFSFVTIDPGGAPIERTIGFEIDDYTGEQAIPPDFPVVTAVTFTDLSLTWYADGNHVSISLPDTEPGTTTAALDLPDTTVITSASLTGVLIPGTFLLADGSAWQAESISFVVELLPQSGDALQPGVDLQVIAVEADSMVPEPAAGLLVVAGLGLVVLRRR
jgi:hypothetical protein